MLIISAAALAVTGITTLAGAIREASHATEKAIEITSALSSSMMESHESVRGISSTLSELRDVSEPTAEQVTDLQTAISQ